MTHTFEPLKLTKEDVSDIIFARKIAKQLNDYKERFIADKLEYNPQTAMALYMTNVWNLAHFLEENTK